MDQVIATWLVQSFFYTLILILNYSMSLFSLLLSFLKILNTFVHLALLVSVISFLYKNVLLNTQSLHLM